MKNIKLLLAYDGTHYYGWQQTHTGPTIQGALEKALQQLLQEPVKVEGASRTDAGVHATGQVANFLTQQSPDLAKLHSGLNALLPPDIRVRELQEMPENFHPTLDCLSKVYTYDLCYGAVQLPNHRHTSWFYPHLLDVAKMRQAAALLVGRHNFKAFCNQRKGLKYTDYTRELLRIDILEPEPHRLRFIVEGNQFLYKMVRNLVGTLVYVGRGKIASDSLTALLAQKDRRHMGITAPAQGLTLREVKY